MLGTIVALGSLGLGAGGLLTQGLGQLLTNQTSEQIAEDNRNWMTRMSNTAHQREVKDLRKAGLNPILSATGGNGASVPQANTAVSLANPMAGMGAIGSELVNTASAIQQLSLTSERIKQEEFKTGIQEVEHGLITGKYDDLFDKIKGGIASAPDGILEIFKSYPKASKYILGRLYDVESHSAEHQRRKVQEDMITSVIQGLQPYVHNLEDLIHHIVSSVGKGGADFVNGAYDDYESGTHGSDYPDAVNDWED